MPPLPLQPPTAQLNSHLAAAEGAYSVVEWLLTDCGAAVNPVDRFKRTPLEDAVRGDHGEVAQLLVASGGRVLSKEGAMVELAESRLSGNVRIFGEWDPEWEVSWARVACLLLGGELGAFFDGGGPRRAV